VSLCCHTIVCSKVTMCNLLPHLLPKQSILRSKNNSGNSHQCSNSSSSSSSRVSYNSNNFIQVIINKAYHSTILCRATNQQPCFKNKINHSATPHNFSSSIATITLHYKGMPLIIDCSAL
jgi:hypothetical protein